MGEPSHKIPMRPSSILAQSTSGFSVVPTCLKGEAGEEESSCATYEESGTPSVSVFLSFSQTRPTSFSSAMPAR